MRLEEAKEYIGVKVRGREIVSVEVCGSCVNRQLYLLDADGNRVMNVTNLVPADVARIDHSTQRALAGKGARHKTG